MPGVSGEGQRASRRGTVRVHKADHHGRPNWGWLVAGGAGPRPDRSVPHRTPPIAGRLRRRGRLSGGMPMTLTRERISVDTTVAYSRASCANRSSVPNLHRQHDPCSPDRADGHLRRGRHPSTGVIGGCRTHGTRGASRRGAWRSRAGQVGSRTERAREQSSASTHGRLREDRLEVVLHGVLGQEHPPRDVACVGARHEMM